MLMEKDKLILFFKDFTILSYLAAKPLVIFRSNL